MSKIIAFLLYGCLINVGESGEERIIPIQQVKFFEDQTGNLSFEDVRKLDSLLIYRPGFSPADYNINSAYWVFYDFCIIDSDNNYIFEIYDQTIDEIDIYLRHESESTFSHFRFGDQFDFSQRIVDHKNFQIKLNKPGQYYGYVRVSNRDYADIRVAIRSVDRFIEYSLSEYFLYGIFYGMIIIISLYNIFVYAAIREIKYIYYTLYILSVGVFAMSVDGIAYQLLWPKSPEWNQIAHGVALFSLIVWSICFSKKFLRLKQLAPKTNLFLNVVFATRGMIFLYALLFDHSVFYYRYIEIIPLSVIFFGSINVFLRGYKPARFFIVAYGFLFTGFILKALMLYSFIPVSWITYSPTSQILWYYSLHLCFIFEMLFLSIALSDRVRILKENRDLARRETIEKQMEMMDFQDKMNKELEWKIQKRTKEIEVKNKELQEANLLLENQKKEIAEINSVLDLDNWKLRNNLKSVQKDRLLNISMNYFDFIEIFPDKDECLRYLSKNKWSEDFECKRCYNTKYLQGNSPYSRRCTKCGYIATPTANTLFHGLKFPLQKAFYLLYLVLNDQDYKSLSELSEEMDLRKNTIWSFRKKILQHIDEYGREELDIFKDLEKESAAS